uniref:Reverse transcriptase zinc-binding domain-containing protein n=2 Tax=Oryza TaxID=4527 RepID=A0A679BDX6_ORYNI|nr:hypothetical protein [Oryza sativa Indica Group]BBF89936.1 hypothetical protein [Oryza sativa f. spontanea]
MQDLETVNHILLDCVFARQVWLWFQDWWPSSRACLPEHLCAGFDSLVLLVS